MKKILTGCLLMLSLTSAKSQVLNGRAAEQVNANAKELRYDARSNAPLYVEFKTSSFISASSGMEGLTTILGSTSNDSWKVIRSDRDDLGMNHSRYQQFYKNIKVITGEYILHEKQGRVVAANGMFFDHLSLSTTPTLTEKQALASALNNIHASKYLWQCSEDEQRILSGGSATNAAPRGELVVLPSLNGDRKQGTNLCWQFDVYSKQPHERWLIYVNAQTGKVEFKENKICTITTNGTAATKYSGTQAIKIDSVSATSYRLRETGRGSGVETYNLQNGTNYATAVDFTSTSKSFTATTNQDNAAYDAHWGAEMTYDYYLAAHNRNSYNNAGGILKSYVHYSTSYNNAFWNGSVMTYGDGDGSTFSPLTELDICAHELSHGVTSTSSNLTYSYESGALNESFSDIFGISTDFFARPSTANWTLGDQSYTPATSGDGIRYMNNPNLEGDPDTYHGTNWYTGTGDNGGVHYNSGVQNFWYYLLCTGGVGTNDVGFSYNVAGITMNKARQIAYRNNTFYLTSGSQYADAAFYAVKSANDIFGNCSSESFSTKNAWDAVGVVGAPLNSAATASVVGGTCSGSTIQFTAAGGITYSWSGPGGFTSSIANPTIPNATATNNGLYSCIITDASGCSGLATAVVSVSASPSVTATGGTTICNGGSVQLNANASASGQGQNSGSNSTALALPDYPNAGVSSNININGSTNASSILSVTIDSLTHTYDGDLKIELISPSGSSIILASNVGSSGDNFIRTKFVSSGTSIANGTAPFTGSFVPSAGSFAGLTGSANGTWSLKITDLGSQDIGTLWKWSIELPGNVIVSYNWTPSTGLNSSTINNPVASPASTTTYTVQVADNSGCTATSSTTVTIGTLAVQTTQTNVSCNSGSNGAVSIAFVNPVGTPTYLWNTGATTSSLTNIPAGTYIYTITNGNGCTTTGGISISQPFVLDGTASSTPASCGSANGSASIAVAGGTSPYTYSWSNGVTTATNNNLTAGTYTITVTDHNGCSFSSSITVASQGTGGTLTTPTSITGTKNGVCPGSTKVYSCPTVANATNYTWTIPANAVINSGQGTNSINVSFLAGFTTGSITVTASNGCATSNTKSATLRSTPLTPGAITGTTSNLCNSISNYSIAASTTGATSYTWSVPAGATITSGQGTTAITVQWPSNSVASGSICVTANNACGSSTSKCLATVTTLPLMPSTVSGPGTACKNQTGLVYSVTGQAGATYTWTVPAKATIVSGQGTPSITVNWGPSTGSVKVTASNSCGTQTTKTKSVVVNCRTGFETISTMELIPNPNDGNATIVVGDEESNYEVIVNDMLGRTILKDNSTAAEYNLHLENQPKGMYLVSVRKTSGENQIFRMIIQ
jgi:Zn-dependent metalloprotease/subtilisin-like proprotein convertase family protein